MNRMAMVLATSLVVLSGSGCAVKDVSPEIVCEVDGKWIATGFTFNSFRRIVEREHGECQIVPNVSIRSRSIDVTFKGLPNGQLLAERVMALESDISHKEVVPAQFFDLVPGEGNPGAVKTHEG
ncbi:MAG: hypothetical protein O3A51_06750 [Verrucomicrobia bacterium]|nr:hypothetical protein [Verrucomicrobiota bacterium]